MSVDTFNPLKVSPSRIGTYADCGMKFKFNYIDRLTPERKGSAALFGSVMHRARESWVVNRQLDLVELVREAWTLETNDEPVIAAFLREYQKLSGAAIHLDGEIRKARPEITNPRMTKDFKTSDVAARIKRLLGEWLPKLESSNYDFNARNPLPGLYDESLVLAYKYSEKYRSLPNSWLSELAFDFQWEGFQLVGFIDEIAPLIDRDTGEMLGVGIIDAKTYRYEPDHEFKDWRQGVIYILAYQWLRSNGFLDELPVPEDAKLYFGVDRMRLMDYRWFEPDERDTRRLLSELRIYQRGVENEVFLPASKTCKADFCDFASQCAYWHGNSAKPMELNV